MGANHATKRNKVWTLQQVEQAKKQLQTKYKISQSILGRGAFGKVYKGTSLTNPKQKVAIKAFKKKHIFESDIKAIQKEISVLSQLNHPNILKYKESLADDKHMYIVTDYIRGVTLAEKLKKQKDPFSEEEAAKILKQLASAIAHCHSKKIAHRDIKPSNIIIDDKLNVTLIDFGLSKEFSKSKHLKSKAGSPLFMAPEIMESKYSEKWDVWSLGILMYILLSNRLPFSGQTPEEVRDQVLQWQLCFDSDFWANTSQEAIDLMERTIWVDPTFRFNIHQVVSHKWFESMKYDTTDESIDADLPSNTVTQSLDQSSKASIVSLPQRLSTKTLSRMEKDTMPVSRTKIAKLSEKDMGNQISAKSLKKILKALNFTKDGDVSTEEFCTSVENNLKREEMEKASEFMSQFLSDSRITVNKEEIAEELVKSDHLTEKDLKSILKRLNLSSESTKACLKSRA